MGCVLGLILDIYSCAPLETMFSLRDLRGVSTVRGTVNEVTTAGHWLDAANVLRYGVYVHRVSEGVLPSQSEGGLRESGSKAIRGERKRVRRSPYTVFT